MEPISATENSRRLMLVLLLIRAFPRERRSESAAYLLFFGKTVGKSHQR